MTSIRQMIEPVLVMLDTEEPRLARDWAQELLKELAENGTPDREVLRAYLKTVVAVSKFGLNDFELASRLLDEAAEVAAPLHPNLGVLVAWYRAHYTMLAIMDEVGRGPEIATNAALRIGQTFESVGRLALDLDDHYAALSFGLAANYTMRSGNTEAARELARISVIRTLLANRTNDGRLETCTLSNSGILKGTLPKMIEPDEFFFVPGELQATLPGD